MTKIFNQTVRRHIYRLFIAAAIILFLLTLWELRAFGAAGDQIEILINNGSQTAFYYNTTNTQELSVTYSGHGGSTVNFYYSRSGIGNNGTLMSMNDDGTYTLPVSATAEGSTYYIWLVRETITGNPAGTVAEKTITVKLDTDGPVATQDTEPPYSGEWETYQTFTFTGTVKDAGIGVEPSAFFPESSGDISVTDSSLTDRGNGSYDYSVTVNFKEGYEGLYRIVFYDLFRNLGVSAYHIKTDPKAPQLYLTSDSYGSGFQKNSENVLINPDSTVFDTKATIKVEVSERVSGIAELYYTIEGASTQYPLEDLGGDIYGISVTESVNKTYTIYARDNAGNLSTLALRVKVDADAPIVTPLAYHLSPICFNKHSFTYSVKVLDLGASGFGGYSTVDGCASHGTDPNALTSDHIEVEQYTENGLVYDIVTFTATFTEDYHGDYYFYFKDNAGNEAQPIVLKNIYVDTKAPVITDIHAPTTWTKGDFVITFRAEDGSIGSGVKNVYYSLNADKSDPRQAEKQPDGTYKLTLSAETSLDTVCYIWADDTAKNSGIENAEALAIKIDNQAPTTNAEASDHWQTGKSFSIDITVTDDHAGAEGFYHSFTDSLSSATLVKFANGANTHTLTVNVTATGEIPYYIWAVDKAGNISESTKVTLKRDTTVPVHTPDPNQKFTSTGNTLIVSGTLSDDLSGFYPVVYFGKSEFKTTVLSMAKVMREYYLTPENFPLSPPLSSDIDGDPLQENVAGLTENSYSFELTFDEDYSGGYYFVFMDMAGNYIEYEITVHVDATPPIVSLDENPAEGKWVRDGYEITLSASDKTSGVQDVYFTRTGDETPIRATRTDSGTDNKETKYKIIISPEALLLDGHYAGTYSIWAVDVSGNRSEVATFSVKLDRTPPVMEAPVSNAAGPWSNKAVTVSVKAEDLKAGVFKVYYSAGENGERKEASLQNGLYLFTATGDQNTVYDLWAEDAAGNLSEKQTIEVKIDTVSPLVTDYLFEGEGIRYLSFGTFAKNGITVKAGAADSNGTTHSGIAEIRLMLKNEKGELTPLSAIENSFSAVGDAANAAFDVPLGFSGTVYAVVTDHAGNSSAGEVLANSANTQNVLAESGYLSLEDQLPTVALSSSGPNNYADWYGGDITFSVDIDDMDAVSGMANAGLGTVKISVVSPGGSETVLKDQTYTSLTWEDLLSVSTSALGGSLRGDGKYVLKVTVTDNAGNEANASLTVYKDTTSPVFSGFYVDDGGSQTTFSSSDGSFHFDYFLSDTTTFRVSVGDIGPSSGISYVTVYTVDVNGNVRYLGSDGKFRETTLTAVTGSPSDHAVYPDAGINSDGSASTSVSFTLSSPFKGKVCVLVADKVSNRSDFRSPGDIIIENDAMHEGDNHIASYLPDTPYKDVSYRANGSLDSGAALPLYGDDTTVRVTVSDTFSGISSIRWSVTYPGSSKDNESGSITVSDMQVGASDEGWSVTSSDANLTTELSRSFVCRGNSNDITLEIAVTDNCGHTSIHTVSFSIDKTKPVIELFFDNTKADSEYQELYNEDMTLQVVIRERNFDPADVTVEITNTDGKIPAISAFLTEFSSDPDGITHRATILFSEDGDYTVKIGYADRARNEADDAMLAPFTIDKTLPLVLVVYDNNEVKNGLYYKAVRTATVIVTEHNFDPARITLRGAEESGIAYPSLSQWKSEGDSHTATILFSEDGVYTFSVSAADKAGNLSAEYTEDRFCIDKTMPEISVSGAEENGQYNGSLLPKITYTDQNFDKTTVSLTLRGILNGSIIELSEEELLSNGIVLTLRNFFEDAGLDDVYTLTAHLTDLAGNETELVIRFCVNRNGSVYQIPEKSKYLSADEDFLIHELNLSELLSENILVRINKNGFITELIGGIDFIVTMTEDPSGYYLYEYAISPEVFSENGVYRVMVRSKDSSGNVSENTMEEKAGEISFMVDKTAPICTLSNLESGTSQHSKAYTVNLAASDNLRLASVKVYDGDALLETWEGDDLNAEFGIFHFVLESADKARSIRVVVTDLSGNVTEHICENVLITTNLLIRLLNNTPLVIALFSSLAAVTALVIFLLFRRKKQKRA